jgi:hypothetical protein
MDDLLDTLHAIRPLWLPSLMLSLAAGRAARLGLTSAPFVRTPTLRPPGGP